MAHPILKEPNLVSGADGDVLHTNSDQGHFLPASTTQFNNRQFAERWLAALNTSIDNRSRRYNQDTLDLDNNPSLADDPDWFSNYKGHETRLEKEEPAREIVNEYLASLEE